VSAPNASRSSSANTLSVKEEMLLLLVPLAFMTVEASPPAVSPANPLPTSTGHA